MDVSYMKVQARHHGSESCLDIQQWNEEALTGENTGAALTDVGDLSD
jgi:hypothetical protein